MTQENFLQDIQKLYDYLEDKKSNINKLYEYVENKEYEKLELVEQFAKYLELKLDSDLTMALISRVVNLRDDGFTQVLKKLHNKTFIIIFRLLNKKSRKI